MNLKITTKNYTADQEKRAFHNIDFKSYGRATAKPTAWEMLISNFFEGNF